MCSIEELIQMSDLEFYEKYLADISLEEQAAFFKKFPEFLQEEPLECKAEEDKLYQKIQRILER